MNSTSADIGSTTGWRQTLLRWLQAFLPIRMRVGASERLRVVVGALIGVVVVGMLGRHFLGSSSALPWLIAPLGASAVLVFAVPGSPMAQPWAVVAGNTVSTVVGICCAQALGSGPWSAGSAVGIAIALMFGLRCLHPPGGACALFAVMAGITDLHFALAPVMLNSLTMCAVGIAFNNATNRPYPHGQRSAKPDQSPDASAARFTDADLDIVIAKYNQVLDIGRDDLQELLAQAEETAYRRQIGTIRCKDIMSREPVTVVFGTPLQEAWAMLRTRNIKALPVVDRANRIVGIVTLADFMRGAHLDVHAGWADRLRSLIRPTPSTHSDKAEVVGQIMSRRVRVASTDRPLSELVPIFATTGHHHIPIIDPDQRLVGIITQSDLVAALYRK